MTRGRECASPFTISQLCRAPGRRPPTSSNLAILRSPLVVAVYVPTLLLAFGAGLLVAVLPLYAASFGVGYGLVGFATSAAAIGTLVTDLPAGAVLGRVGLRPAMIAGSGLVAFGTLALVWSDQFNWLVILRFVAGIGTALWALSRHAYIAEAIPPAQRGQALSMFGGINRLGIFAGPAIGGFLTDFAGINVTFAVSAALSFLALILSAALLKEVGGPGVATSAATRWRVVWHALRRHWQEMSAAAVAQTLGQMIRAGRFLIIPLWGQQLGLDAGQIGTIVTLGAIIDVSMFIPAGWIMDRFGRKVAAVPSFSLMALGMALIPFSHDFLTLSLVAMLIGLGNGLGSGLMMTLGADLAPPGATGEFLGIWRLVGDVGGVMGPIAVGLVAAAVGLSGGAWVLSIAGWLAVVTLAVLVQETRHARE
ncbi:MAG: MFS transporter [Chloroflexota bacterium]|nr:MFS transporter [Chloroflexota bacterium]